MAPADIDDFRSEPRKTKAPIKLEEIFDDSLLASNDAPPVAEQEPEPRHVEPEPFPPSSAAAPEKTHDVPAQVVSGAFDALGEDEFTVTAEPVAPSSAEKSGDSPNSDLHGPLDDVLDGREVEHSESVAPVAKIVRTAEVQARNVTPPNLSQPTVDIQQSRAVPQESYEHQDTLDLEEDMERLLEEENVGEGEREYLAMRRPSKLVGFLVSYELERYGRYIELREGRLLVSSEGSSSDNCLVIEDASVSPMHAIMRISSNGTIMILDQLSEHGTRIKRAGSEKEEALLGDKGTLEHGDVVIFGECGYHVCIIKGI
jgi:hypothetical protein